MKFSKEKKKRKTSTSSLSLLFRHHARVLESLFIGSRRGAAHTENYWFIRYTF